MSSEAQIGLKDTEKEKLKIGRAITWPDKHFVYSRDMGSIIATRSTLRRALLYVISSALGAACIADASAQNVIQNPGFETNGGGVFSTVAAPWVLSNGAVAVNGFARSGIASFSPAGIGTAAGTYNGSATQTVAVAIPGTYSLTFYAATQAAGPYSLVASINGITLINTTVNSTRYQLFTATAVLAAGLATLAVSGASAGAPNTTALFLDDFSLIMAAAQNLTLTPVSQRLP